MSNDDGDASQQVRRSCLYVMENSKHVAIDVEGLEKELENHQNLYDPKRLPPSWAQDYHFCNGTDLTAQYVLVLDSLNFCFWPLEGYEYCKLASSLRDVLKKDSHAFDADRLEQVTGSQLSSWLQPPQGKLLSSSSTSACSKPAVVSIPMLEERVRLVREIGRGLRKHYGGKCANMVRLAKGSTQTLIDLTLAAFPAFRDHCMYKGKQIFLYKRVQIFVGDIWGAYEGKGLGHFHDIDKLTTFPDYRIPQVLHSIGVLKYSSQLEEKILSKTSLLAGSEEEVEIRAATVQTVELIVEALKKKVPKKPQQSQEGEAPPGENAVNSVLIDWLLWERGEMSLGSLPPHHRVLTIYY